MTAMDKIKEKPMPGKPRTLARTVRVLPSTIRTAARRSQERAREQAEHPESSPSAYALDRSTELAADTAHIVGDTARVILKSEPAKAHIPQHVRQSKAKRAEKATARARRAAVKTAEKPGKPPKQAAQFWKSTFKAADKTVGTARNAAAETARQTKTAHTAAKAAVRAARSTVGTVKAASSDFKTAAVAAKGFAAAFAASGWIVIVIIAAGTAAAILCSAFGIFFSDEADPGKLKQAIFDINTGFMDSLQARIDGLSSGGYDAVNVIYEGEFDGDSFMVNNWTDVLGVYAVSVTTDKAGGREVMTIDDKKKRLLQSIFDGMNTVSMRTDTEGTTATVILNGKPVEQTSTTLNIYIGIQSLGYAEGANLYAFDENQMEMLEELMSPRYYSLFADLINVDIYGGMTSSELAGIVKDLPAGTKGGQIAQAAISKVGTPYSVMDCSQLSRYAYGQAGISLPRTSVEQAKHCQSNGYTISSAALQPGDLIFWSRTACRCGRWNEIHHVGVYIGGGRIVDASSANGRVVLRDIWSGGGWQIVMYARPHV